MYNIPSHHVGKGVGGFPHDGATSHSNKLAKNASKVAGYGSDAR